MVKLTEEKINSLMELKLTKLKSGDSDNGVYLSAFSDEDKKRKMIVTLSKLTTPFSILTQVIFNDPNIDDDVLRYATTWLTFSEILKEMHGDAPEVPPQQLYFALLVNWNASNGSAGITKIASYDALNAAKRATKGNLDYRDYIINGPDEDTKFNNDYKSIKISPKQFSTGMTLELPIIKGLFGATYKFATGEKIPGKISFDCDSDGQSFTVPANIWMKLISEGLNSRRTARFSKLNDFGNMSKLIADSPKDIVDIMLINNVRKGAAIMNVYQNDIDEDGTLFLRRVRTKNEEDWPELKTNALFWDRPEESDSLRLGTKSDFYIVHTTSNSLDVYLP